ncbi:MAG: hypothetical protein LBQ12_11815, partial [Deltaproteobacteria bacterium]|nr:hypothetical protein [Deltaproteobacteria bacterium]
RRSKYNLRSFFNASFISTSSGSSFANFKPNSLQTMGGASGEEEGGGEGGGEEEEEEGEEEEGEGGEGGGH